MLLWRQRVRGRYFYSLFFKVMLRIIIGVTIHIYGFKMYELTYQFLICRLELYL